jgi:hypothetical protein
MNDEAAITGGKPDRPHVRCRKCRKPILGVFDPQVRDICDEHDEDGIKDPPPPRAA